MFEISKDPGPCVFGAERFSGVPTPARVLALEVA